MSKKNNKKNNKKNDIAAVAEVAAEESLETLNTAMAVETGTTPEAIEEEGPTVVTAEESASEPEASANVEIQASAGDPTEHHIRVKSDSGVFDVTVHAETRQEAKYKVYLQLEQFGENATVPKFNVEKYLARHESGEGKKGGKKKGDGKGKGKKTRNVIVEDLDCPDFTKDTDNKAVFDNPDVTVGESSENIM